jgi:hypothetical protein
MAISIMAAEEIVDMFGGGLCCHGGRKICCFKVPD